MVSSWSFLYTEKLKCSHMTFTPQATISDESVSNFYQLRACWNYFPLTAIIICLSLTSTGIYIPLIPFSGKSVLFFPLNFNCYLYNILVSQSKALECLFSSSSIHSSSSPLPVPFNHPHISLGHLNKCIIFQIHPCTNRYFYKHLTNLADEGRKWTALNLWRANYNHFIYVYHQKTFLFQLLKWELNPLWEHELSVSPMISRSLKKQTFKTYLSMVSWDLTPWNEHITS